MQPRQKKLIGVLLFLPALILYVGLVLWIADHLPSHWAIYLVFYVVAGTAWAFPLKPVFRWMNSPAAS
ncbi:DUF2842 domain-containing protein [Parvularcula dongshanensis]|uniref:DUF2842 domain-containing protein n=1 Tax=Parvularcula dongshanensis TaxID=1173995 RepID=A0A840I3E9_9PROT|nr:DUF2842 domain-containing protein [Parvularcula dongshanensis]MBB4658570.1 hypothetical protein [Parvularcula dongshanensis]